VADRDPDIIKAEIDEARERLAATVDTLTERANPHRIAEDAKSKALAIVQQPRVKYTLAGLGVVVFLLVIRRFRRRY
jgi:hypothetical protein